MNYYLHYSHRYMEMYAHYFLVSIPTQIAKNVCKVAVYIYDIE